MKKSILFILLSVIVLSCSKKIIYTGSESEFENLSERAFLSKISAADTKRLSTVNYTKFSATVISSDSKNSFKGFLRLRTDSVVMISVAPAMGIEVLRLQVKQDSIGLIDRFNKNYSLDKVTLLQKKFGIPVNYDVFQSLLLASLPGSDSKVKPVFKYSDTFYTLEYFFYQNLISYSFIYYFSKNLNLKKVEIQDFKSSRHLTVDYGSWFLVDNTYKLPERLSMQLMEGNKLDILNVEFNEPKVNEILNFPFSISDKYERVYY